MSTKNRTTDARHWLIDWGYPEVIEKMDRVTAAQKAAGKGTRRSWWEALAGDSAGRPRTVEGIEFPVIKAFQVRRYGTSTPNAIQKDSREKAPPARAQARWGSRRPKRFKLNKPIEPE